jgi:hypothetical protein
VRPPRAAEAAGFGGRPTAAANGPLELLDFKPLRKGTLRGFARVRIVPIELDIADVVIGQGGRDGRVWALLPSKPMVDRNGAVMRDAEGRVRYAPILGWASEARQQAFSCRVAELAVAAHPEAFDAGCAA